MPILASRSLHTEAIGVALDAATLAWVAAVISNGGSVSDARKTIVNTLIVGLKADSIWTKLDRLWPFAAENQPSALTDLVGLTLATAVGSPTFTADSGYVGNGSSSYIDTNYNPSTDGVTYQQDSAHGGAWVTSVDATSLAYVFGGRVGGARLANLTYSSPSWLVVINSSSGFDSATNFGNGAGHIVVARTGASTAAYYGNGGSKTSSGATSTSVANATQSVDAENDTGIFQNYGQHLVAAQHFGGGLSDADVSNLYTRLRTYMDAVGVP